MISLDYQDRMALLALVRDEMRKLEAGDGEHVTTRLISLSDLEERLMDEKTQRMMDDLGVQFGKATPKTQLKLISQMATGFAEHALKVLEEYTETTHDMPEDELHEAMVNHPNFEFVQRLTMAVNMVSSSWEATLDAYQMLSLVLDQEKDKLLAELKDIAEMN